MCLLYGLLAVALGWCWQATLVYVLYGGNWTSLFYQGYRPKLPDDPVFANTYVFPDDLGYDGEYYRIVAHDPVFSRGWYRYVDLPSLRYRRILAPAMAWVAALGQQRYIDRAYFAVILGFLFLGVFWLGRYAVLFGCNPAWGLAFLLVPGTLAGLERGLIDIALLAVTIGFALYLRTRSGSLPFFLLLLAAGLIRETGVLLMMAYGAAALVRRDWRQLLNSCAIALPVVAWYLYVRRKIPADRVPAFPVPLTELWKSLLHFHPTYVRHGVLLIQMWYYLAVVGIVLAFFLAIRQFPSSYKSPEGMALMGFALLGIIVQPSGMWLEVYGFGRQLAPLPLLLGLQYFPTGDWRKGVPLGMVASGILTVSAASGLRVLQNLAHKL